MFCFTSRAMCLQVPAGHGIKPRVASCLPAAQRAQAHAAHTPSARAPPQPRSQRGVLAGKIKAKRRMKLPYLSQRHGLMA